MTTFATQETTIDPTILRQTFGHFPSGVAAIATEIDGAREVIVASSFSVGVSLDPALALFSVQKTSATWPKIARGNTIGVSILNAEQDQLCRQLAGKNRDGRLQDVATETLSGGAIIINNAAAWFECSIYAVHEAGDHDVVIFQIHDLGMEQDVSPLVFHGSRFSSVA